jgi:hypothetical protein
MGGIVWAAMERGAGRRVLRGGPAGVDLGVLVGARALGAHVVQQVFDRPALLLVRPDGEQVGAVVAVAGLVVGLVRRRGVTRGSWRGGVEVLVVVAREVDQLNVLALLDVVGALRRVSRRLIGRGRFAVIPIVVLLGVIGLEGRALLGRDRQVGPADDEGGVHRGARLRIEEGLVLLVAWPTTGLVPVVLVGGNCHIGPASLRTGAPFSGTLGVPVPVLPFSCVLAVGAGGPWGLRRVERHPRRLAVLWRV